jgi:hypothetical protein
LILTLRALQNTADNQHSEAPLSWDSVNQLGQQYGAPDIDYDRFAARWDTDPILKQLVARFDGHGLVVKTKNPEDEAEQGEEKPSMMDKAAERATKAS